MSAEFRIQVAPEVVAAVNGEKLPAPAVETRGLDAWYGDFQSLRKVDFSAAKGRVTAIIGPSGCGKSTLLRALNRMNDLVPGYRTSGEMILEGSPAPTDPAGVIALRRRMGMLFQRPNPFPMSVFDNVAYGLRLERRWKKHDLDEPVERALTRAGLWEEVKDRLSRSALGLSGGQQQRLCLARSLAVDPQVILMDEPTSALDPIATLRVEELMREFRDEVTIIIVTHNMQQAARVSDVTAFMMMGAGRAGELVEINSTIDLFNRPSDRRTEDYITGRFG
ncbi:MAG: phosphate ABC transporter ATP-binding protein [Candidatus Dormibacteraeota bacterium]|uniref:Phosphate ABC transporter ATP-binding protein n=1 Tax=Candidatus Amunia macphersoniae TaxID=3127014 RepID=A0A934KJI2_9BACT|nr:phosphate ABC transporter ATP-binding protein [Candidatus Dormibacteraeota bacterium]